MEEAQERAEIEEAEVEPTEMPIREEMEDREEEERDPCRGRYEDRKAPTEHRLDCAVQAAEGDFRGMILTGVIVSVLICCLARKGL